MEDSMPPPPATVSIPSQGGALRALASNMVAARLLLLAVLLVLWEIYARLYANHGIIASPSQIIVAMRTKVFANPQVVAAIRLSLYELVMAYGLSVIVGLALGIAIGVTEFGRRCSMPIVLLLYSIPQVVLLPLVVMILGFGPVSKIAFGFIHGVFPVVLSTVAGMRDVNPLLMRSARSMGGGRGQIIRHVILPNMAPIVFAGLRLAMTLTLLGVLLSELYISIAGIGKFAQAFGESYDPAPLFALIFTLAIMAVMLNELIRLIESRFTRWKR